MYTKDLESETVQDDFLKGVTVKLPQEEKEKLDEDFTQDELKASMNDLNKNKCPGSDGLTKEIYDFLGYDMPFLYRLCK